MMELTVEQGRKAFEEAIERVGERPEIIEAWQEEAGQLQEEDALDASLIYCIIYEAMKGQPDHFTKGEIQLALDTAIDAIAECPKEWIREVVEDVEARTSYSRYVRLMVRYDLGLA